MNNNTPDQKKLEEDSQKTMNYNDRLDGYGFGEAESGGEDTDLREKYGEVDQYTFRVAPIGGEDDDEEDESEEIDEQED